MSKEFLDNFFSAHNKRWQEVADYVGAEVAYRDSERGRYIKALVYKGESIAVALPWILGEIRGDIQCYTRENDRLAIIADWMQKVDDETRD